MGDSAIEAALFYVMAGWFPIPLCWPDGDGQCGCGREHQGRDVAKAPLLGKGYQVVRATEREVRQWWGRWPQANVGILLEPSGLLVIDLDSREAYLEARELGLPDGPVVGTGKGAHVYYRSKGVTGRATRQGRSHSIDVLAKGYVVAPPSLHANGRKYVWVGL